jgi:tRNA pseudouridine38/39 synthase
MATTPPDPSDYAAWSHGQLLTRVLELESQVRSQIASHTTITTTPPPPRKPKKPPKPFDARAHPSRRIALKFAYQGRHHHGLEHHRGNPTALSTVEEELWRALVGTRLIALPPSAGGCYPTPAEARAWPAGAAPVDWAACEFSKCGRTDKGVSAFGQVVSLRVRSSGAAEEIPYVQMLNRALPPSVRALAWCADLPANFDARFSCKEREYRYFFTAPAFLPLPGAAGEAYAVSGALDVQAMQEATGYLIGQHDFRNMCKVDGSKQITEYKRMILHASIDPVGPLPHPTFAAGMDGAEEIYLYTFTVRGSAFLWHQVRCMAAILFLVGQRLEAPSIVQELLDVEACPTRPMYEMADDQPLVLWDCRFSATHGKVEAGEERQWNRGTGADELEWIYPDTGWRKMGLMEDLWASWRSAKFDEVLWSQLLDVVACGAKVDPAAIEERRASTRVFAGESRTLPRGKYVPLMERRRMEHFEVVNARWAERKGAGSVDQAGS